MSNNENIWELIVRYLNNTLSGEDSVRLENWLDKSNENRRILHSADQIWKASEEKSQDALLKDLNLEKDWDLVAERIHQSSSEDEINRIRHFSVLRKRQQFFSNFLKIAALVLVAVTSGFLTLQYAPVSQEMVYEPVFNEITTKPGERANIDLGDGSNVQLNADSKLIMPDTFSQDRREVELKGQAYFNIKSDRTRPFFIRSGDALVEVIGTSFDVRSYDDENEIRVVVREGTVELRKADNEENILVLNEGYLGRFSRDSAEMAVESVEDMEFYLAWMNGRLIFKDTDIEEVLAGIERWYNVDITLDLSDESFLDKKFTADLKTRSVKDVLDVLGMSMNIEFEIDEDADHVLISN
ncbi:MAG: FecR domain-containing protein [Balneolaceae bacterium]